MRRLTRAELDNSATALLGFKSVEGQSLAIEDLINGFPNHDQLQVSSLLLDQLDSAAQKLSSTAVEQVSRLVSCQGQVEEPCVRSFLASFGKRAYRRPLSEDEVSDLYGLFLSGKEGGTFKSGIQTVVNAVLQSASFLYKTELGRPGAKRGERVVMTPHEIASAISYLVTASPPDDELMAAADQDALKTPEQREAHVRRLYQDPRARPNLSKFVVHWMGLQNLASLQKDNQVFPDFSVSLRTSMKKETDAFIEHVLFEGDRTVGTLLGADFTFVDPKMASFYGLPAVPTGTMTRVSLQGLPRLGLLTQASVLATYAHNDDSSPILRGKLVRTRLLCQPLPPPPPTVNVSPPEPDKSRTTRERVAAHTSDPACASCHVKIDPIGFGMEDFDGIGKHRTIENGKPVDPSGELAYVKDQAGPFSGAAALAHKLASSTEVRECVNVQLFRYGMGRREQEEDTCMVEDSYESFSRSNFDVLEQLVGMVRSEGFVQRRLPEKG